MNEQLVISKPPRGTKRFEIQAVPVPKPRQTRRDKWQQRPNVMRYRAWADVARASAPIGIDDPENTKNGIVLSVIFYLPMPSSWSQKKRDQMKGTKHLSKPDLSNYVKAIEDSLFPNSDSMVWRYNNCQKLWDDGLGPRTVVELCDEYA